MGTIGLDKLWYEKYKKITEPQHSHYFGISKPVSETEKNKFLLDHIENPQFTYPHLNPSLINKIVYQLDSLDKEIVETEPNPYIKGLYHKKILATKNLFGALLASAQNNMAEFANFSTELYGELDLIYFNYTVDQLGLLAKIDIESTDPDLSSSAKRFIQSLPQTPKPHSVADPKSFEPIIRELDNQVATATHADTKTLLNSAEAQQLLTKELQIKNIAGWEVIIDGQTNKSSIRVNTRHQQIIVPPSRTISLTRLQALIAHEIDTHVLRSANGFGSPILLLGSGLHRYAKAEEGLATVKSQIATGRITKYSGLESYLAVGLAVGLDGQPRNFRQVFDIVYAYYAWKNANMKNRPNYIDRAKNQAWKRCARIFRGTDGQTTGICYTKDKIYLEGNIQTWQFLAKNRDKFELLNLGKFDPENEEHMWGLKGLKII